MHGVVGINMSLISCKLYIKESSIHGWGLFANEFIKTNQIITQSPSIIFPTGVYCPQQLLPYTFSFEGKLMLGLGHINFINSSENPNTTSSYSFQDNIITIKAIKDIQSEEEITLKYL